MPLSQVLGTLEASGLRFDHLWVAGLHDEAWPGAAEAEPVPSGPHAARERAAALLPRTGVGVRRVDHAAASGQRAGHGGELSRTGGRPRGGAQSADSAGSQRLAVEELSLDDRTGYAESVRDSRLMEQMVDEQAPPLGDEAWQRGGTKVFQYQSTCPFRAFVELRLGAEELDTPVPGLDMRRRGTLVHAALEEFWKEVRTHDALCERGRHPRGGPEISGNARSTGWNRTPVSQSRSASPDWRSAAWNALFPAGSKLEKLRGRSR